MRLLSAIVLLSLLSGPASIARPIEQVRKQTKEERKAVEQEAIRAAVRRGEVMPLPKILAIAKAKVPGEVVKIELEQESWGIKYEVKILTATGLVREVELNARTGELIRIEDKAKKTGGR